MKTRIVQTRIWEDAFVAELPSKVKLLFVYLLTNPRLELTGAYEITPAHMALDTGLTQPEVRQAIDILFPR